MALDVWLAFVAASVALLMVPGPTVVLAISYALGRGRSSAWATVPGTTLGDFVAMTVSLLGAGAVLAASATLFTVLKWLGALYLIWLGIKLWRAGVDPSALTTKPAKSELRDMFRNAFVVTALNPKSIVFFVAFVPQFIDPAAPALVQFAILEATFLVLAAVNILVWVLLAGQMQARFQRPETLRWVNRTGACFLMGAGVLTATLRRV